MYTNGIGSILLLMKENFSLWSFIRGGSQGSPPNLRHRDYIHLPSPTLFCGYGEIGIRIRLKILGEFSRAGSSPVIRIIL